ncbi:MAG: GNAT family N-acetyltransferase [Candidatus Promineofilum sp.]|nr:GNAT family N-acetyltransferase [Promineifilum sp.]MBP9656444.1 GNAT family N-acetyltransferase [Promineifilum sp.]
MFNIIYSKTTGNIDWEQLTADLRADDFDNGRTPDELRRSFENSAAVAFARYSDRIIGKARALSDGVCNAYVVDVWTCSNYRRQGIGTRLMRLLEEQLEGQHIYLFTDDAEAFYRTLGYQPQGVGMGIVVGHWLRRR